MCSGSWFNQIKKSLCFLLFLTPLVSSFTSFSVDRLSSKKYLMNWNSASNKQEIFRAGALYHKSSFQYQNDEKERKFHRNDQFNDLSTVFKRTRGNIHPRLRKTKIFLSSNENSNFDLSTKLSTLSIPTVPSEKFLKAVEKAKYRGTATDFASIGGLDIRDAEKEATALTALVDGELEVTSSGDLIFNFDRNFRRILSTRSNLQRMKDIWARFSPILFYLLRVGFGVALVTSLVLIYTTIIVAISSSSSRDDENRERRQGSANNYNMMMNTNYYFGPNLFDFFYFRPRYYYGYGGYYVPNSSTPRSASDIINAYETNPEEMGFLESCFSYLFGDGNPNYGIDQARLRAVAEMIRINGGAVVAEQLAPYLTPEKEPDEIYVNTKESSSTSVISSSSYIVDESYVLPILTALNGRAEVSDEGDILYIFPDLMTSATSSNAKMSSDTRLGKVESFKYSPVLRPLVENFIARKHSSTGDLEDNDPTNQLTILEEEIPFSRAKSNNLLLAAGLGIVNLLGALYLGNLLSTLIQQNAYQMASLALGGTYSTVTTASGELVQVFNKVAEPSSIEVAKIAKTLVLPGILGFSQKLYPFLLAYAVSFNTFPLIRYFWIKRENKRIQQRNALRKRYLSVLNNAVGPLYEKVLSARKRGKELKAKYISKGSSEIEYSSSKSILDNKFDEIERNGDKSSE